MPLTVPVNVGEARLAFKFKEASTLVILAFKSKADCVAVEIGLLASEVLSTLLSPTILCVMPLTVPVNVGLLIGAFNPIAFDTVVEKLASLPRAEASSFNVSSVAGALATRLATAVFTNSVVAICVEFVLAEAVGAEGVPVKVGEARSAFKFKEASTLLILAFKSNADWVAVEIGLLASEVLSTFPRPTILFEMPLTVPVKVGLLIGAFNPKEAST